MSSIDVQNWETLEVLSPLEPMQGNPLLLPFGLWYGWCEHQKVDWLMSFPGV